MKKLALFASGEGTNVQQITDYFLNNNQIKVDCIIVNKLHIHVIDRAGKLGLPWFYFNKNDFYNTDKVLDLLKNRDVDYLILAGFLWLIPQNLLQNFEYKILNIHPALLPKYGGKGMYGHHVHQAVVENKEKESGITIHYVNEHYDAGDIIFQAKCKVDEKDTIDDVAAKIHLLEKKYYPKVIEQVVLHQ